MNPKPGRRVAKAVDVTEHGAMGDGVTDDTASVNAARLDAQRSKLPIYFPGGNYLLDPITMNAAEQWQGAGTKHTRLLFPDSTTFGVQMGGYCRLSNLALVGPSAAGSAVGLLPNTRGVIDAVQVQVWGTGIKIENSYINRFFDCYVDNNDVGVYTLPFTSATHFVGGEYNINGTAFEIGYALQLSLVHVTIEANTDYGLRLVGNGSKQAVVVRDSYFELNGTADIDVSGSAAERTTIQGNLFSSTSDAILVSHGTGTVIDGNVFHRSANGGVSIQVTNAAAVGTIIGRNASPTPSSGSVLTAFDIGTHDEGTSTTVVT